MTLRQRRASAINKNSNNAVTTSIVQRSPDTKAPVSPTATKVPPSEVVSAPTSADPRGWQVRCSLFGHHFRTERPLNAPPPTPKVPQPANAGGSGLPLGGVEAHAYLQCGVSRLRNLLSGDSDWMGAGDGGGGGGGDGTSGDGRQGGRAVLSVELLHSGCDGGEDGDGEDEGRNRVRCYCEVHTIYLVDAPHEGLSEPALACWENASILFCTTRPRSEGHTFVRAS